MTDATTRAMNRAVADQKAARTPPAPPPHFVRADRGAGGWAVSMPYKAQGGDVVTIQKNRHRVVVRLTFFIDMRGHLWKYEKFGQIDRDGTFHNAYADGSGV